MSQMYVMFPYELNILEPVSSLQYPRGVNVLVSTRQALYLIMTNPWVRFPYLAWIFMMFSHTGYSSMILFHIHELIILGAKFMDLVGHSKLFRITDLKAT